MNQSTPACCGWVSVRATPPWVCGAGWRACALRCAAGWARGVTGTVTLRHACAHVQSAWHHGRRCARAQPRAHSHPHSYCRAALQPGLQPPPPAPAPSCPPSRQPPPPPPPPPRAAAPPFFSCAAAASRAALRRRASARRSSDARGGSGIFMPFHSVYPSWACVCHAPRGWLAVSVVGPAPEPARVAGVSPPPLADLVVPPLSLPLPQPPIELDPDPESPAWVVAPPPRLCPRPPAPPPHPGSPASPRAAGARLPVRLPATLLLPPTLTVIPLAPPIDHAPLAAAVDGGHSTFTCTPPPRVPPPP